LWDGAKRLYWYAAKKVAQLNPFFPERLILQITQ
jgi:hypothetical protein